MKNLLPISTTLLFLSLLFMSFLPYDNQQANNNFSVDFIGKCDECHALVNSFQLLTLVDIEGCGDPSAAKNLNDAINNYNVEDCYSLYSLFHATISYWSFQADCRGVEFCADVMCKARCMASCLSNIDTYSSSILDIQKYLENTCECDGNDCYSSCNDEFCEADCCSLNITAEPVITALECCVVKFSANSCNAPIEIVVPSNTPDGKDCVEIEYESSGDAIVSLCCLKNNPDYNPILEVSASASCNGEQIFDQLSWNPREDAPCALPPCCRSSIEIQDMPSTQGCCAILFKQVFEPGCIERLDIVASANLVDNITIGGNPYDVFVNFCPTPNEDGFVVASFEDECGNIISTTWVPPCLL